MTKAEYLSAFGRELKRLGVADAGDVLEEYEQHFEFKGRDGCTEEEEVSARLGDPAALAAQFAGTGTASGSGALTAVGLGFMWIFAALFFVLLAAWAVVMAAFAIACAACAVCLAVGVDAGGIIPDMPYYCALLYALALAALSVLSAVGTVYYALFVRAVGACLGALCAQHARICPGAGRASCAAGCAESASRPGPGEPGVLRWRRWRCLQPASCWAPW